MYNQPFHTSPQNCTMPIGNQHILIVDDNSGDVELLQIAFEMSGLDVHIDSASDGVEAIRFLEQAAENDTLPVLMVLDLNMPGANGFEVLQLLRERHFDERVAVVVLSTSAQAEDRRRCLALGARAMYCKPESMQELRRLVAGFSVYIDVPERGHEL